MSSNQQASSYVSLPRRLRRGPSPEYGVPRDCFCGLPVLLQTSRTTANPGRRFFTCRSSEDGGRHIWKWWDEAMMEEFTLIYLEIQESDESFDLLARRIGCGKTSVVDPTGKIFYDEISQLKQGISANEKDIAEIKNAVLKYRGIGDGKYVLMGGLTMVCVTVLYLFS